MDLRIAQTLARSLMETHGLSAWQFDFDRASRRFGACFPTLKKITLSWKLTLLNEEPKVRETLLHEIAHALTPGDGHGLKWRRKCVELGIAPERCFTEEQVQMPAKRASRFEIGCTICGWWQDRHRVGSSGMVCKSCRSPIIYRVRASRKFFRVVKKGKAEQIEWFEPA